MEISHYEATGLAEVAQFLAEDVTGAVTMDTLRQLLVTANVAFVAEGINRLQSMLLCELKDSYVQQSQRYVAVGREAYSLPPLAEADRVRAHELMDAAVNLYQEMSVVKEAFKGRPRKEHYVYGIPMEDARYILPVAVKTNISIAMSGDKLLDLFRCLMDPRYGELFAEMRAQLLALLPESVGAQLTAMPWQYGDEAQLARYYQPVLDQLTAERPVQLLGAFANLPLKVGLGAMTSTMAKTPSAVLAGWGDDKTAKATAVAARVMSYGHDSVAEQGRTTFGLIFSLVTYHQQVRHRLSANFREDLENLIDDGARPVVLPESIAQSPFRARYLTLAEDFKVFRKMLKSRYHHGEYLSFLLNCDRVKVIMGTNIRLDNGMLSERICFNAQWEIRQIATAKLALLRTLSETLYEKALPPCVYGVCGEGKYTCGRAAEMRQIYGAKK